MRERRSVFECVINVSEGRRAEVIASVAAAGGDALLDAHSDPDHHRSVLTLAGDDVEGAARAVAARAVASIDLRSHRGAHPRLGAVDVVPFVALAGSTPEQALAARNAFASWAGTVLSLPCFLYGPERSLPDVRRQAFVDLAPDSGPGALHPTAGAAAVGARPVMVAYNLWLAPEAGVEAARDVARAVRGRHVRALGLDVGGHPQVSLNLTAPLIFGPAQAYDAVARLVGVARAELVGLVPAEVLVPIPARRWPELDLGESRTIEGRLEEAGIRGA